MKMDEVDKFLALCMLSTVLITTIVLLVYGSEHFILCIQMS